MTNFQARSGARSGSRFSAVVVPAIAALPAVALVAAVAAFTLPNEPSDQPFLDRVVASVTATPSTEDASVPGIASEKAAGAAAAKPVSYSTMVVSDRVVATGPDDWLVLTSGQDTLKLHPDTAVVVAKPEPVRTRIQLRSGTVEVAVGKRAAGESFEVQTRYLVAIVKGTKFEVSTTRGASAVSVTEGRVLVRAIDSGDGVDVTPGQTAIVSSANPDDPEIIDTPIGGATAAAAAAGLAALEDAQPAPASSMSGTGSAGGGGHGSATANHAWRPRFNNTSTE